MDLIVRIILTALYPVLLGARLVAWLSGRDPLRLREPAGSCWIERPASPEPRTYFSEVADPTRSSLAAVLLMSVARAFAPRQGAHNPHNTTADAMTGDIPDEVYTLW